ncbi:hypothetical protein CR513_44385, partial [Mucuna pruriens]
MWKWRNLQVHDPNFVRTRKPWINIGVSSIHNPSPLKVIMHISWQPPPSRWVRLNIDGSAKMGKKC